MDNEKHNISDLDAMLRLAEVFNDSPTEIEIAGQTYNITALKIGTQVLIAEETCRIQKSQEGNLVDIMKQFAASMQSIVRCLAFAVLNNKDKIYKDYATKEFSTEFYSMCEKIEWESDKSKWFQILTEVIKKIDINFSLTITEQMSMIRDMMMKKRNPEQ